MNIGLYMLFYIQNTVLKSVTSYICKNKCTVLSSHFLSSDVHSPPLLCQDIFLEYLLFEIGVFINDAHILKEGGGPYGVI